MNLKYSANMDVMESSNIEENRYKETQSFNTYLGV